MAKLRDLLTDFEITEIQNTAYVKMELNNLDKQIKDLTVYDLSIMSFILIHTEYNGAVPTCNLPIEALSILTRRAKEKEIGIF